MMRSLLLLLLFFFVQLALVSAVPWSGPSSTPCAAGVPEAAAPVYTDAPQSQNQHDLLKRDAAPGICGWIEGFSQNPYSCAGTSTCYWNTEHQVIACGVDSSATFQTKCVAFTDLSASCDLSCSFNPSINRCPASIPYCVNITVGGNYIAFACGSSAYTSYPAVELTYTSQTTLDYLPRFLGADGVVTLGTQTPSGYIGTPNAAASSSTESSLPSSSSPSSPSSTSASPPFHTGTQAAQGPSTPTQTETSSSTNIAAIAGGAAGGVVGLAAIAGIIVFFVARSRRKKVAALQENAQVAAATEQKQPHNYPSGLPQGYPPTPYSYPPTPQTYPPASGLPQGYPPGHPQGYPQAYQQGYPQSAVPSELHAFPSPNELAA